MIAPFNFARTPHIIFGNGKLSEIPSLAARYGSRAALVTGRTSLVSSGSGQKFFSSLDERGIAVRHISIHSEPSPEMIDNAVADLRHFEPEVVIAVGGGSVLDAGKAISAMLCAEGSVTLYLEEVGTKEHPGKKVPFIAAPTTSGTGSEATKNAVISRTGENGFKRSLRHDNFTPDIAVIDPSLTLGCPPAITAASGMDCFTQLLESYLSPKGSIFTDALALEGIREVKDSLVRTFLDGSDQEARTGMAFAALTSGICLANAGLGVVHGFASSIGAMYDLPHGHICGTLMAASNAVTLRKLRQTGSNPVALRKYSKLGRMFLGEERSDEYLVDFFIGHLHELTDALGLKGLKTLGVNEKDIPAICDATGNKNNPVQLDYNELSEILRERFV